MYYTGLFEMIVGVLTTCHTQCTSDMRVCFFLFNRTTLQVLLHTLQMLYICTLWDSTSINTIIKCTTQNAFSLPFAAILVNCAPSGEMHNYCTPHIIKENLRISISIGATTYYYLKCSVYDELLKPRQSFRITLYIYID